MIFLMVTISIPLKCYILIVKVSKQGRGKTKKKECMIWNQHICVKYVTQKVLRNHTICNMRTFPIILYKIKIYNLWLIVLFCLHLCLHHILFLVFVRIIKNIFIPFQSISLLSNKPKCTSFILLSKWNCGGVLLFSKCRIFFYDFFRIPGTMIYNDKKKTCAYLSLHSVNILVIDGMLWRYIQKKMCITHHLKERNHEKKTSFKKKKV